MSVRPKKHLGQHFLNDQNIAQKIAESLCAECRNVVEIGPGTGVLTQFLLQKIDIELHLLEIDRESVEYLQATYPFLGEKLHEADFLKFPLQELFNGEEFCISGNFPYNISSQILFRMLENRTLVPCLCGMFQKEVAERICAQHGNKTYGILSVLAQAYYKTEYLFTVDEHVFTPPPKVKSGVIRLQRFRNAIEGIDEPFFFQLVKTAFNQRRKTLRNALKPMNLDQPVPEEFAGKRAEQLSPDDFLALCKAVRKI